MELSLSFSNNVSFITPDKWLSRPFGKKLRQNQMRDRMYKIVRAGSKIFPEARIDSVISIFSKKSTCLNTYNLLDDYKAMCIMSKDISHLDDPYLIDSLFSDKNDLVTKLDLNPYKITDLGIACENSCATHDFYVLDPLIKDNNSWNKSDEFKLITTGTIKKYESLWGKKECKYNGRKY